MGNGTFGGHSQPLYFPAGHEHAGLFKGMANILEEQGFTNAQKIRAECISFKCEEGATNCCCRRILYNQPNFVNVEPVLKTLCREAGHEALFLPKFHCELKPIEMLWGYAKYRKSLICYIYCYSFFSGYRNVSDGKFATAKRIVPECLNMCNTLTIRQFFRKAWRYMDAYANEPAGRHTDKYPRYRCLA